MIALLLELLLLELLLQVLFQEESLQSMQKTREIDVGRVVDAKVMVEAED